MKKGLLDIPDSDKCQCRQYNTFDEKVKFIFISNRAISFRCFVGWTERVATGRSLLQRVREHRKPKILEN